MNHDTLPQPPVPPEWGDQNDAQTTQYPSGAAQGSASGVPPWNEPRRDLRIDMTTPPPPRREPRRWLLIVGSVVVALIVTIGGGHIISGRWLWQTTGSAPTVIVTVTATHPPNPAPISAITPGATVISVATATATTSVPVATLTCTIALPGASDATTGSQTITIPFLAQSITVQRGDSEHDGYQQRLLGTCTTGNDANTVSTSYGALLIANGWQLATTSSNAACTSNPCWTTQLPLANPALHDTIAVSLDTLHAQGSAVTYQLTITAAPFTAGIGTVDATTGFSFDGPNANALDRDLITKGGSIETANSTLVAILPHGTPLSSITYATCTDPNLHYSSYKDTAIPFEIGGAACLKTSGSKFAALVYTSSTQFAYKTYAVTF